MKSFSDLIIGLIVFALVLVSSVAARYVSIPPDSLVNNIFERLEPSPKFIYFVFGVIIFYVVVAFIRPPQK